MGNAETPELCFEMVAKQEPNANGVTYGAHGQGRDKECYAEFEMTHVNKDSPKWQACLFEGISYSIHMCVFLVAAFAIIISPNCFIGIL